MMDWQKKIIIIFCPLLILVYFFVQENKKAEVNHRVTRTIASFPTAKTLLPQKKKIGRSRKIAAVQGRPKYPQLLRYRIPQSIKETFEKNENIKLTKGYDFLSNVAAISKDSFEPSLGSVIQRTEGLVFFRANPGHPFIPVAISRSTNMLYPISSVLHVKGATPVIRDNLLKQGYHQYYYHPPLKLLSLETKAGEVVKVYSDLKKQGFRVELEVLKPQHQTF